MTHLRANLIPLEHLLVELNVFPLASVDSLRLGPTELKPQMERTGELWRCAESSILKAYPGVSVDELTAMRDRVWFDLPDHTEGDKSKPVPLHEYVTSLAQSYLRVRGHRAVPCLRWDHGGAQGLGPDLAQTAKSREAWRWMSFALPEDLLLAALTTEKSAPVAVEVLSPQWERTLLDAGFAETHLHLGAALDFRLLWASTMRRLCDPNLKHDAFASPGAELRDGRDLAQWLLHAALARCVLAAFLVTRQQSQAEGLDFAGFLSELGLAERPRPFNPAKSQDSDPMLAELSSRLVSALGLHGVLILRRVLQGCVSGDLRRTEDDFGRLRRLYSLIATPIRSDHRGISDVPEVDSDAAMKNIQRQDPLATWFEFQPRTGATPEMQFLVSAFRYLHAKPKDQDFAKLLWQVVRVRNIYYRHVVLRPMTPGLQWFVRTYDRMKPGKHSTLTTGASVASACDVCGLGKGLRSLEVRTAPENGFQQVVSLLEDARSAFAKAADSPGREPRAEAFRRRGRVLAEYLSQQFAQRRSAARDDEHRQHFSLAGLPPDCDRSGDAAVSPEFGVVFHLVRQRHGGAEKGQPNAHWRHSQADPRGLMRDKDTILRTHKVLQGGKYRYLDFYSSRLQQVNAVSRALLNFPLTLTVLRGIDACTDELGVPTWVLVPLFRFLHDVGCLVSAELERQLGCHVPPLRTTLHAGEDFVHLLGGLRRIDEALRFLELREGDRLGHAIALGVHAAEWARSACRIPVPREDRWLDLIWEWCQYARERLPSPPGRQLTIERELEWLTRDLLGERLTPGELELFVELLHDESMLMSAGFPYGVRKPLGRPSRSFVQRASAHPSEEHRPLDRLLDLLRKYLTSPNLFDRGREVLWVETAGEVEALEILQRGLCERVAAKGLCVEINPSSNLLIANLGGIEQRHPLWRLNSPFESTAETPIPVCIGSDDPLTFATNVRAEYMLVHDALIASGLSYEATFQWLDQVRRNGMAYRFTLPQDRAWRGRPLTSLRGKINESRLKPPPGR